MLQQAIFTLAGQKTQVAINPARVNAVLSHGEDEEDICTIILPGVRDQPYGVQFVVDGSFESVLAKLDAAAKAGG